MGFFTFLVQKLLWQIMPVVLLSLFLCVFACSLNMPAMGLLNFGQNSALAFFDWNLQFTMAFATHRWH
jgi:hypothetical protein